MEEINSCIISQLIFINTLLFQIDNDILKLLETPTDSTRTSLIINSLYHRSKLIENHILNIINLAQHTINDKLKMHLNIALTTTIQKVKKLEYFQQNFR